MKARPILMSTPMVQALLDGRKTQTRRIVKPTRTIMNGMGEVYDLDNMECPYGKPGDLLFVRERIVLSPFATLKKLIEEAIAYACDYHYFADFAGDDEVFFKSRSWKSKPAIHMPRSVSRLTLEITEVRVERLRDISEQDCIAEGIAPIPQNSRHEHPERHAYAVLWESINGSGSWEENPWVWALSFRVHKQNVDEFMKGAAQ